MAARRPRLRGRACSSRSAWRSRARSSSTATTRPSRCSSRRFLLCLIERWYTAAAFVLGHGLRPQAHAGGDAAAGAAPAGPPRRWLWPLVAFAAAAAAPFVPYLLLVAARHLVRLPVPPRAAAADRERAGHADALRQAPRRRLGRPGATATARTPWSPPAPASRPRPPAASRCSPSPASTCWSGGAASGCARRRPTRPLGRARPHPRADDLRQGALARSTSSGRCPPGRSSPPATACSPSSAAPPCCSPRSSSRRSTGACSTCGRHPGRGGRAQRSSPGLLRGGCVAPLAAAGGRRRPVTGSDPPPPGGRHARPPVAGRRRRLLPVTRAGGRAS